jgi:hypothetical protein
VTYMADVDHRIYSRNLDDFDFGWKRRFWPSLVFGASKTLEWYPQLESLVVVIKAPRHGCAWRPALFDVKGKTREQRVGMATRWFGGRCPLGEELRGLLRLEIDGLVGVVSKEEMQGSRFAVEDDEDEDEEQEWDCGEFGEAFVLMLGLPSSR